MVMRMPIFFNILRNGAKFEAEADGGTPFFVGYQTKYQGNIGLYNVPTHDLPSLVYSADDERGDYKFWADFIGPTALCEGGNYLTLNTYDRAKFTWGFGQFAAHVPDGDFVLFFRDLLGLPQAADYFPNLLLSSDRVCKVTNAAPVPLESATSTAALMDYLNPSSQSVDDDEVIAAAKLIHWTAQDPAARSLQVKHMIAAFKRLMIESDKKLGLDGQDAQVCCVICDIRHQGRATYADMLGALKSNDPLDSLLTLGKVQYPGRIDTLSSALANNARFQNKFWRSSDSDFV